MAKEFKVLKIDELSRIGNTGRIDRYYRHTIETAGGTVLTVDIDEADFTQAKAAPILLARAVEADKILRS